MVFLQLHMLHLLPILCPHGGIVIDVDVCIDSIDTTTPLASAATATASVVFALPSLNAIHLKIDQNTMTIWNDVAFSANATSSTDTLPNNDGITMDGAGCINSLDTSTTLGSIYNTTTLVVLALPPMNAIHFK